VSVTIQEGTFLSITNKVVSKDEKTTEPECRALSKVLARVGDKWTVMVVGSLSEGPLRYKAIQQRIG
jgi:DNA-binding HxlR family transcriptional regulator